METITSKKFQTMVLALAATLFNDNQGAPWYVVVTIGVVAVAYLVAQGYADRNKGQMQVILKAVKDGVIKAQDIGKLQEGGHLPK